MLFLAKKMVHSSSSPSSFDAWLFSTLRIVGFLLSPKIWKGCTELKHWLSSFSINEAIFANNFEKCQELIEKGIDCNQCGKDGNLPLIMAAAKGNVPIVRLLVEKGKADITKANESGETALFSASLHGHLDVVDYLLQQGADKDTACCLNMTSLMAASSNGHLDVVRYLIDQGCCVNTADMFGRSALHAASQRAHTDVVICLMQQGMANLDIRDRQARLPIDLADNKHNVVIDSARCEATKQAIRDEENRRRECYDHTKVDKQPCDYETTLDRLTATNTKINSNSKWLRVNFGELDDC